MSFLRFTIPTMYGLQRPRLSPGKDRHTRPAYCPDFHLLLVAIPQLTPEQEEGRDS